MTQITYHVVAAPQQSRPLAVLEGTPDSIRVLREAVADRYSVDRQIGHGGMANVYLGRDGSGRSVAIKLFHPHLATNIGVRRFLGEIDVTRRLKHANIVEFIESGDANGLPYFVMSYVEGETLRARLLREHQLELRAAVEICADVTSALEHAHELPVVHRDVKPENLFLTAAGVVVADFGIAKALEEDAERLTSTGVSIGTPAYMSPEQGAGSSNVDRRSDIYSLGCVLYEMLAGEPPFPGGDTRALIAKHVSQPPPFVRVVRPNLPEAVEDVIQKALAKAPADRYSTAREFSAALEAAAASGTRRPPARVGVLVGGTAVAVGVLYAIGQMVGGPPRLDIAMDTTSLAILPFVHEAGVAPQLNEVQVLSDAIARWTGIKVVDPLRMQEAVQGVDVSLTGATAARAARRLGAGRYVRGTLSPIGGDSVRVQGLIYDAVRDSLLGDYTVRLSANLTKRDSLFAQLGDRLLLRELYPKEGPAYAGTKSLPARQAFARGQQALETWDLAKANSAFTAAVTASVADSGNGEDLGYDPDYAEGHLWVALVRAWKRDSTALWSLNATRAWQLGSRLAPKERVMAGAILDQARGDLRSACGRWRRLTATSRSDFLVWYGAAHCLRYDSLVVRDPASPSGWRFRSSYSEALRGYTRAFELNPAVLWSFRSSAGLAVRSLIPTSATFLRSGYPPAGDTTRFAARAQTKTDSLEFVPYPVDVALGDKDPWDWMAIKEAVRRQRRLFREVAVTWASAFPISSEAMEALAVSLQVSGDPATIDTLRRARSLARTKAESLRIATAEVWAQVKLGLPHQPERLVTARDLADSLLRNDPEDRDIPARAFAGIATLTGRPSLAGKLLRRALQTEGGLPPTWVGSVSSLLIYASLGGPIDSLQSLEGRTLGLLGDSLTLPWDSLPVRTRMQLLAWPGRAATLVAPLVFMRSLELLKGRGNPRLDAQAALRAGGENEARRSLERSRAARAPQPPEILAIDALFPEANMWLKLGDTLAAIQWLDPTLKDLPLWAPETFSDPARAGALIRTVVLRSELAHVWESDSVAAVWARAASILLSDDEEFLKPTVARMRLLANRSVTGQSLRRR